MVLMEIPQMLGAAAQAFKIRYGGAEAPAKIGVDAAFGSRVPLSINLSIKASCPQAPDGADGNVLIVLKIGLLS